MQQAPSYARDLLGRLIAYAYVVPDGGDPLLAGAFWAAQTFYEERFGDVLGPQLAELLLPIGQKLPYPQVVA